MRERRNPSAHTIPLSIPPAIHDQSSISRYRELEAQMAEAQEALNTERWSELRNEQDQLGKFFPFFIHHPDEVATPIYPTVPEDLGNMARLTTELCGYLITRNQ
jgi:hypothetical protein